MSKKCFICQDTPCNLETCKRDKFIIENCTICPVFDLCNSILRDCFETCNIKIQIEILVNERNK